MSYIRDALFPGMRDYYTSMSEDRSRNRRSSRSQKEKHASRHRPRSSHHTSRRDSADSGYSSYAPSSPIPRQRRKSTSSGYGDYGYDYEPTYGTYVWERTNKKDPADCPCKCCPHSYTGARRAAGSSSRHDDPPSGNMYGSVSRTWYPLASEYVDGYGALPSQNASQIKVINETEGSLRRKYGSQFSIGLNSGITVDDILSTLARDSHKYRVVVNWDDGTSENLQDWMSVSELRRYATYLEIKQKKRVRFA